MRRPLSKTDGWRGPLWLGALACAAAWGLVELVALQRSRYHLWRERHQVPAHR